MGICLRRPTQAPREDWAIAIDSLLTTYSAAIETHRTVDAAATVAEASFRTAIRTTPARLAAFKRDLLSLGLTQVQVREIIPDASVDRGSSGASPGERAGPARHLRRERRLRRLPSGTWSFREVTAGVGARPDSSRTGRGWDGLRAFGVGLQPPRKRMENKYSLYNYTAILWNEQ